MTEKTSGVMELALQQDEVKAQYKRDFGLTEGEFMKVCRLFLPHPVPPGLTDAQMDILIILCDQPKVACLRREQRACVIVPKEWSSITPCGTVRRMDHYRFKQGLARFMEQVAQYRSVSNATTKI